jgi:ClpP class serine protease
MGRKGMSDPLITVVKLSGILASPAGRSPSAARRTLNLDRVEKWLQRAFLKELRPAACAISINSPGGSPVQTELIFDMIARLKKQTGIPVYTFAEDVAASGGYWLMCAGDEAYGCATSLVGSIGVISASFGAVEATKKLGIERRIITAGHSKASIDPFLPVSEDQRDQMMSLMTDVHQSFKNHVKMARGNRLVGAAVIQSGAAPLIQGDKNLNDDDDIFSGRVFTGHQAVKVGLLDGVGTLRGVMREKFGDKSRFLMCSEAPQARLRDYLGFGAQSKLDFLNTMDTGSDRDSSTSSSIAGVGGGVESLLSSELGYEMARVAVGAAMDEVQERAVWDRWNLI